MTGDEQTTGMMTRREWLRTSLRWCGVAMVVGIGGLLGARSVERPRSGTHARPVGGACRDCPRRDAGCTPGRGCMRGQSSDGGDAPADGGTGHE